MNSDFTALERLISPGMKSYLFSHCSRTLVKSQLFKKDDFQPPFQGIGPCKCFSLLCTGLNAFFIHFRQLVRQYFLFFFGGGGAADSTDSKKDGILYLF
jgi:hypothetical protein